MPHSGGGGSHGGGSHGGSSGSGGTRQRHSHTYFSGAHRYVYYEKNKPVYVYADYDITTTKVCDRPFILLLYIPFLFGIFMMAYQAVHIPGKIAQDYNADIYIEDNADVIDDDTSVKTALKNFYDETGVAPVVLTVIDDAWVSNYDSLENYAYSEYINRFDDEKHWLVVFSEPEEANEFIDWKWEVMIGDDTGRAISDGMNEVFRKNFHDSLLRDKDNDISEALVIGLDALTESASEVYIDWGQIAVIPFVLGFICFHAYFMAGFHFCASKYRKSCIVDKGAVEDNCEWCGGMYVIGTVTSCPYCGGTLKAHNPPDYGNEYDIYN